MMTNTANIATGGPRLAVAYVPATAARAPPTRIAAAATAATAGPLEAEQAGADGARGGGPRPTRLLLSAVPGPQDSQDSLPDINQLSPLMVTPTLNPRPQTLTLT